MKKIWAALLIANICFAENVYVTDETGTVSVIDSATNMVFAQVDPTLAGFAPFTSPFGVAVSQDGSLVCVTDQGNHSLYFINGQTNAVITELSDPAFAAANLLLAAFTPDMSKVIVTNDSAPGNVFIVDAMAPYTVTAVPSPMMPAFVRPTGVVAISNSVAYVADRSSFTVYNINITMGTVTATISGIPAMSQALYLGLSSDGTFAFLSDFMSAGAFKIDTSMDIVSATVVNMLLPPFAVTTGIAVIPNNTFAFMADFMSNAVYKIDTTATMMTCPVTASITDPGFSGLRGLAATTDNTAVYVCSYLNGKVFSVNTTTNAVTEVTVPVPFTPFVFPTIVATSPVSSSSSILPPSSLGGTHSRNDFGIIYSLENLLTWQASPSTGVAGYNVYRNSVKIASVGSSTLEYRDNNAPKGNNQYAVTAFNAAGTESSPIAIQIQ